MKPLSVSRMLFAASATLGLVGGAVAQTQQPSVNAEAIVLELTKSIDRMRCTSSSNCPPATPEELRRPIVSNPIADAVFRRGIISGVAKVCGLDWQTRNFLPLMSDMRVKGLDDRQTAIVGALHGVAMGQVERTIGQCSEEHKAQIVRVVDYKR